MKRVLFFLAVGFIMYSLTDPVKIYNGQNTDFRYYSNKYDDFWEKHDSLYYNNDSLFSYKLGGQLFVFNQEGKRQDNYAYLFKHP